MVPSLAKTQPAILSKLRSSAQRTVAHCKVPPDRLLIARSACFVPAIQEVQINRDFPLIPHYGYLLFAAKTMSIKIINIRTESVFAMLTPPISIVVRSKTERFPCQSHKRHMKRNGLSIHVK